MAFFFATYKKTPQVNIQVIARSTCFLCSWLMDPYQPEFTITSEMFLLAEKISENLGKLSTLSVSIKRKEEARIRNIQASLAIEGHCLSPRQVKDLANGKDVPGRQADILAVKNAIKCYEECKGLDPFDVESLLKELGIMMEGLVKAPRAISPVKRWGRGCKRQRASSRPTSKIRP